MPRPFAHRMTVSIPFATMLLAPALALAGPDERSATWDMSLDELRAIGLGQYRADPVPVPPDAPFARDPAEPPPVKQAVVFVNFDGAQLSYGYDDSRINRTYIQELVGSFAPYGQGSKREAVMQAVRTDWAPFNVLITDSRPASGDYTMNMVGPTNPYGPYVLGIALLDCNDAQTPNNITYAFHSANDSHSASTQATTIGQEVAHSYGLEHVMEPADIMNPQNVGGDPSFRDECIPIDPGPNGIRCGPQHAAQCGSSNMQNSYRELLALFGPAVADESPPTVAITSPEDGAVFEPGADFDITAQAEDDQGIDALDLYVDGAFVQSDGSAPYGWGVENIPEGTYELYVVARDLSGNETTSDVVTIVVGDAAPPDGGGSGGGDAGGGSGGGDGGGTGDGGDSYEPPSGSLPPGFGIDDTSDGCGCALPAGPSGAPAGLALVVLAFVVRKRRVS